MFELFACIKYLCHNNMKKKKIPHCRLIEFQYHFYLHLTSVYNISSIFALSLITHYWSSSYTILTTNVVSSNLAHGEEY
jgi:hypothetical protein